MSPHSSRIFVGVVVSLLACHCTVTTSSDKADGGSTLGSGGAAGTGGAAGSGGTAGTADAGTGGAAGTAGAADGSSGAGGAGGTATVDAGAADGASGSGGAGEASVDGGSGGSGGVVAAEGGGSDAATPGGGDPCGADPGNDDRDHATPYTLGSSVHACLDTGTDQDFYEFTAPTTPAQGGFVTVRITDVGVEGNTDAMAYQAADNGEIQGGYTAGAGESNYFFFAAAPDQKYRVRVKRFSSGTKAIPYTFTVIYTGVPDANEPNDTKATATSLTVGTALHGYIFAGHTASTGIVPAAYEDWFKVTLTAGTASVQLTDISSDLTAAFTVQNGLGQEISSGYETTAGASVVKNNITIDSAGDHYVKVTYFARPAVKGTGNVLPTYGSMPYSIKVVQP